MYKLEWTDSAKASLKKNDGSVQRRILNWLKKNIDGSENPRAHGKALTANLAGSWRYRIGDYRVVCIIKDSTCTVTAVSVGHRSKIYT